MTRDWKKFQEMRKLEFTYVDDMTEITVTTRDETLPDIIQAFRGFLLSVGFQPASVDEYIEAD